MAMNVLIRDADTTHIEALYHIWVSFDGMESLLKTQFLRNS